MKTRFILIIFLTIGVGGLAIFALISLFTHLTRPLPILTGYLSLNELNVPSDSDLLPEILNGKLTRDALDLWVHVDDRQRQTADEVLDEVAGYLKTYVTWDLSDDPLFRYTHYYRLTIENEGGKTFRKVFVKFPDIQMVEVRRRGMKEEILVPVGGKYFIGDVNPDETLTVYGWNDRPFYVQEESNIVLGHEDGFSEILHYKTVEPRKSWLKQNFFLMVIFIVLIFLLFNKMLLTIRSCIKQLDPKLEDKTTI